MHIGQVSTITGFSRDTLRWYEKIGLIHLPKKTRRENNYRVYDEETLEQLILIKQCKAFGFTLNEIKELLNLDRIENWQCSAVSAIMQKKLTVIDQKILELQQLKSRIIQAKETCTGNCKEVLEQFKD